MHSGERKYSCIQCNKSFQIASKLKNHIITHGTKRPFKCNQCDQSFKLSNSLKAHNLVHTDRNFRKCKVCDKALTRKGLTGHMLIHSGVKLEKLYICDVCQKAFDSKYNLKVHMMDHSGERPLKCNQCLKAFKTPKALKSHMPVHCDDYPFKCATCDKSVKTNIQLKRHSFIHNKDMPHRSTNRDEPNCCPNCWIVFKTARNLKNHYKQHCKINSFKLPETYQKHGAMIVQGKQINYSSEKAWLILPEEGELGNGLEEGEL